jgi:hypothetical protein
MTSIIAPCPLSVLLVSIAHKRSWQLNTVKFVSDDRSGPGTPKFSVVILDIFWG